jgi:hypothetical protein
MMAVAHCNQRNPAGRDWLTGTACLACCMSRTFTVEDGLDEGTLNASMEIAD